MRQAFILCFLLTLVNLSYHFIPSNDSMLNASNTTSTIVDHEYLQKVVDYHQQNPAFARRFITTSLISISSQILPISNGVGFIIINYLFLFLSGIFLYKLSLALKCKQQEALLNLLFYFLSFSVFFSFHKPIYTYEEPLQYSFLFLSLLQLLNKRKGLFALFFFLSLMIRETSIILLAGALYLNWQQKKSLPLVYFIAPIILYTLATYYYIQPFVTESNTYFLDRFKLKGWAFNFSSNTFATETIIMGMCCFLAPMIILIKNRDYSNNSTETAFWISLLINTLIVLLFARAREARLFALPLIFFWPIFGTHWRVLYRRLTKTPIWKGVASLCAAILIAWTLYEPTASVNSGNHFREYFFVYFSVCIYIGLTNTKPTAHTPLFSFQKKLLRSNRTD